MPLVVGGGATKVHTIKVPALANKGSLMPVETIIAPLPLLRDEEDRTFQVNHESLSHEQHCSGAYINALWPVDLEPKVGPYQLFSFQERTMKHLTGYRSAVLIARSGVGKLEVGLATGAAALAEQGDVRRVVILTWPSLVEYTAQRITEVTGHTDVLCARGTLGPRWRSYAGPERWVVVPYSCVYKDQNVLRATMGNTMLIIDSPSAIKNAWSNRSMATNRLISASSRCLTMMSPSEGQGPGECGTLFSMALKTSSWEPRARAAFTLARRNMERLDDFSMVTITASN